MYACVLITQQTQGTDQGWQHQVLHFVTTTVEAGLLTSMSETSVSGVTIFAKPVRACTHATMSA
jgi:hypothetical protein